MGNPRDYAAPGNQDPRTPWPDSIVLMSAIAAVTQRLRLIGAAIIAPLRHPLLLAHQLAALDLRRRGPARRAADGQLAPRRVRGARRAVRRARRAAGRAPGRVAGGLDADAGVASRAATTPSPTSTSSPSPTGRRGRACGSAARRWRRGSSAASSPTATACTRSASRPPRSWRRCTRRWRAAGRDPSELEVVGGIRARFPDDDHPGDLDEAAEAIGPQLARRVHDDLLQAVDVHRRSGRGAGPVPAARRPRRGAGLRIRPTTMAILDTL